MESDAGEAAVRFKTGRAVKAQPRPCPDQQRVSRETSYSWPTAHVHPSPYWNTIILFDFPTAVFPRDRLRTRNTTRAEELQCFRRKGQNSRHHRDVGLYSCA